MVIGTGDMSELALGWATYNGDHMSMYGVNAGVPKTLVKTPCKIFSDTCEDKELSDVLNDVLDTPVSLNYCHLKTARLLRKQKI